MYWVHFHAMRCYAMCLCPARCEPLRTGNIRTELNETWTTSWFVGKIFETIQKHEENWKERPIQTTKDFAPELEIFDIQQNSVFRRICAGEVSRVYKGFGHGSCFVCTFLGNQLEDAKDRAAIYLKHHSCPFCSSRFWHNSLSKFASTERSIRAGPGSLTQMQWHVESRWFMMEVLTEEIWFFAYGLAQTQGEICGPQKSAEGLLLLR